MPSGLTLVLYIVVLHSYTTNCSVLYVKLQVNLLSKDDNKWLHF
jgi:hypothetical protein